MNQNALIPVCEITHKLVFPDKANSTKDEPKWRQKLLTTKQARFLMESINGRDQFIIFGGESFPKFGCYVKKLHPDELEMVHSQHSARFLQERVSNQEKAAAEARTEKLESWKKKNAQKWTAMVKAGKKNAKGKFPQSSDRVISLMGLGYATDEAEKVVFGKE